jgi:hypothetical protein
VDFEFPPEIELIMAEDEVCSSEQDDIPDNESSDIAISAGTNHGKFQAEYRHGSDFALHQILPPLRRPVATSNPIFAKTFLQIHGPSHS